MTNFNYSDPKEITDRIIPATLLRRNFGAVSKIITNLGYVVLTVKGKPMFKVEKLSNKKEMSAKDELLKNFGAWKGTDLDDDKLWEEILGKERIRGTKKKRIKL